MRLLLPLLLLLPAVILRAQGGLPEFTVAESAREFISGSRKALVIEMPGIKEKMADKVWKPYIDKYGGKTRKMKELGGYLTTDTEIYTIGGLEKMNVYARFEESREGCSAIVWFELKGRFLNGAEDAKAIGDARTFLEQYGLQVRIAHTEEELEAEEKSLKNLEKNLDRLKREHDGHVRDIELAKEKIRKAEAAIEENGKAQVSTGEQIGAQQTRVQSVRDRLAGLKR